MKSIRRLFLLCIVFGCLFAAGGSLLYIRFAQINHAPLAIQTFDKLNDPYHPSVRYFAEGWNGYKYWMAESPFSASCYPYRDANEIPSVHASNDGIHWEVPVGLTNPIVRMSRESLGNLDYYSDPHIVMRGDTMEIWYRKTNRHGERMACSDHSLRKVSSSDGVYWSPEEIMAELQNHPQLLTADPQVDLCELVSPALIPEGGNYTMYYVNKTWKNGSLSQTVQRSCSSDGKEWSSARTCRLQGAEVLPWHIDVQYEDDTYWLVVHDSQKDAISLWKSADGLDFSYVKTLVEGTWVPGPFYGRHLYRACMVKADGKYLLYFTGDDGYNSYIGLMSGDSPESLEIVAVDGRRRGLKEFAAGICWDIELFVRRNWSRVRYKFQN